MVNSISGYSTQGNISSSTVDITNGAAKASNFEKKLNAASESGEDEKLMEAAREFESYFLQMMLKEMRNTVPRGGLIPKSTAEEIFESMLDEEYSKNAAKGTGMGLAQMIYNQMTKMGGSVIPPVSALAQIVNTDDAQSNAGGNNGVNEL